MTEIPATTRQLRSMVTTDGDLELSIATLDTPTPADHEVLVRLEAAPINPSDLGLLLAGADVGAATVSGSPQAPLVRAPIPAGAVAALRARIGESLPVGNEGAGVVVAAGQSPESQALIGKVVAIIGGATYSEYRCVPASSCLVLPDGTDPIDAASCFVNPLTALSMVEVMRIEGHHGLVHTAAASNLGQMLVRICLADSVPLVNVVRRPEQAAILRGLGAEFVCDSSAPSFLDDLTDALIATKATLAFDAVGGGQGAGQILGCMEAAATATATSYSRYGSTVHKQVYIYGGLDRGPTELVRKFGMAWGVSGWLLTPFLSTLGLAGIERLRQRVAHELTTTFASHYTDQVSLAGALSLDAIRRYAKQATGEKFLIRPTLP
jgi:NADPH:quinone reductase-like Zn-dependent oxidoreductase